MTKRLSRETPDEQLQAPEYLDRALYVTTPKAWLALSILLVMVGAVIAWSIMGKISTYVQAEGIILSRGGMVVDAVSSVDGTLSRVLPSVGDTVTAGDLVANIFDSTAKARYVSAVSLAEERAQLLRKRVAEAQQENTLAEQNIVRQRKRLDELERADRELVDRIRGRLRRDEELLARGVIDRVLVERGEQALDLAQRNLFNVLQQRDEMETDYLRRVNDLNARVAEARAEHVEAQGRVNELTSLLETWRVQAPASGRVTEIRAQSGATLEAGEAVLSIETGEESLDVLFYISQADGKRIKAGMPAQVAPATVKREEFGSMTGTVESLSEFPVSLAGMEAVLKHHELAMKFMRNGPPYAGRVALTLDASTLSGFAWTSPQARDVNITPGTLAEVEVEVGSRPPAALVVPWIKKTLGL